MVVTILMWKMFEKHFLINLKNEVYRVLKVFLEDNSGKNKLRKSLYQLIHKKGVISMVDFINEFKVPQTTMSRMVSELEDKGLIQICGYGESSGGRPPLLYEVVPTAGYLVGIEIARSHVNITLQNIKFELIDQEYFTLTNEHTPEITINTVVDLIHILLDEHSIDLLVGIGVGAVGPLDREKGIILSPDEFPSKGWENVPIVSELQSAFPVPIILNNGANTAALAEYENQQLHDEDILYCMSGYGIRCGFINKRGFLNIREGDASSFGHMIIEPNGKLCICGKKGCINAYVSFHSIFNSINDYIDNEKIITVYKIKTIEELLASIENNQYFVKKMVLKSAYYYGIAIANMINILHPSTVILHGKLIYQFKEYYDEVVRVAKEHMYTTSRSNVLIRKGELAENAIAIGAAIQVFTTFLSND